MVSEIASWISIIEGVAVVSTLFFLAMQVRQNNITSRVATRTAAHEEGFSLVRLPVESETIRRLSAGTIRSETATLEERAEIDSYFIIMFYSNQNWHYMMEQGLFSLEDLASFRPFGRSETFVQEIRKHWEWLRPNFQGAYRDYMDAHIQSLTPKEN